MVTSGARNWGVEPSHAVVMGDHGDAMLKGNSVEGRWLRLGNAVVELALQVGDNRKLVDFGGKACLKLANEGVVPGSAPRRAKHGFTASDLRAVVDPRSWADWREPAAASGVRDRLFGVDLNLPRNARTRSRRQPSATSQTSQGGGVIMVVRRIEEKGLVKEWAGTTI